MPQNRRVERDLPWLISGVGVCLDQNVKIWLDEYAHRKLSAANENLGRRFVLSVKHLDLSCAVFFRCPPRQANVQLGSLPQELLDQRAYASPNGTRVDTVVVVDVLQRKHAKEVHHAAHGILIQGNTLNRFVTGGRQSELDPATRIPESNGSLGPAMLGKHVSQVRSAFATLKGLLLELLEFRHAACHSQVGRALAPIAARMSQSEVVLVVCALLGQRDGMVNVELILVEYGIDGVVTNEAFSGLPFEQATFKRSAVL